MPAPGDPVLTADEGTVRVLTLNRPARLNAFTAASYRALAAALDAAGRAPEVRVVLLLGAGRGFSSGVDLDAIPTDGDPSSELSETFDELLESLLVFSKPLIAGVHGAAVGFGATILLHCDVVLVADDSRIRMPFTALGTAPEAGSSLLLPDLIGLPAAAELLFTSRWLEGAEAVRLGLAARCCSAAVLPDEARSLARAIAEQPPAAVAAAKRLIRSGRRDAVQAALRREREAARSLSAALGPIRRVHK
jgi:enoyl-CoA hydratase/carnithine racemase